MAKAYIEEFRDVSYDQRGRPMPVAEQPSLATQVVEFSTATKNGTPLKPNTRLVRLIADAKAHYTFGNDPTATADHPYLAADASEFFGIPEGGTRPEISFYDGTSV